MLVHVLVLLALLDYWKVLNCMPIEKELTQLLLFQIRGWKDSMMFCCCFQFYIHTHAHIYKTEFGQLKYIYQLYLIFIINLVFLYQDIILFLLFGHTLHHAVSYFPVQRSNLCPLYWEHIVGTTGLPGESQDILLDISIFIVFIVIRLPKYK